MSFPAARVLAEALGVARAMKTLSVLDLAAGSSVWSIALAQASPQVRVTAVDRANVIPVTRKVTALGHILHSEGEQRSRELIKKTFQHWRPAARSPSPNFW